MCRRNRRQGVDQPKGLTRRQLIKAATVMGVSIPAWAAGVLGPARALAAASSSEQARDYFSRNFGVDEGLIAKALARALSRGAQYSELFFQHSTSCWVGMEDGRVNKAYSGVALGVGVRAIDGEKVGYAFTQSLEPAEILSAAASAAELATAGASQPGAKGQEIAPPHFKPAMKLYPITELWSELGMGPRLKLVEQVGGIMAKADPRVERTLVQMHDGVSWVMIATSEGLRRAEMRPITGMIASCVVRQGKRRESNFRDVAARDGIGMYNERLLKDLARGAVEAALIQLQARSIPGGEMPVVLAAGSAGILLHEAIGHGLEADFNRRGVSAFSGRLGEVVAPKHVTIVDSGLVAHNHGAVAFDDEGTDGQFTVLVDRGRLVSYMFDRLTARYYGRSSTGSGRRQSFEYAPMPRMRITFMEPGPYEPEEIIASVKHGILAQQFTNGQVRIGVGDFSFYVKSGWLIENGRLVHPIKEVNVVGNGPRVLTRIKMVGNDLALARGGFVCGKNGQDVPVSQGLPTTLVERMNVGGRG